MKVEGPSKSQSASKAKGPSKTQKSGSDGFDDFVAGGASSGPSAEGAASVATTQSIAHVDALLAVQEVEDPTERAARKKMQVRAGNLLKELDKIKTALLTGNLTVGHCVDIADMVSSHREKVSDPSLTSILDEIDLRAQVEIAKMRKALEGRL